VGIFLEPSPGLRRTKALDAGNAQANAPPFASRHSSYRNSKALEDTPIDVGHAHDVVFTEIADDLHLDQLERPSP
jgi:hypothetical protein